MSDRTIFHAEDDEPKDSATIYTGSALKQAKRINGFSIFMVILLVAALGVWGCRTLYLVKN